MALSNIEKFISAGFDMAQYAVVDSSGYMKGITGTIAANGTAAMGRVFGAKTADVQVPEADRVPITGDNGLLGTFLFPSIEPISFNMEVGQSDFVLSAKAQGTNVYDIGPYYKWNMLAPSDPTFEDFMLLLTSNAQSKETGQQGSGYHHVFLGNVQLTYLGAAFNERAERTFSYSVVTNPFTAYPWGQSLDANVEGTAEVQAMEFFSENRVAIQTYIDDGAAGTFTLDRTPVDAQHVLAWRNGSSLSVTVNTATRAVTFSAGTSGDVIVVLYEYA